MKNILIITYSFPPFNNVASKRYGNLVKYFQSNGYNPYVITTKSEGDLKNSLDEKNIFRFSQREDLIKKTSNKNITEESKLKNLLIELKKKMVFRSTHKFSTNKDIFIKWENEVIDNFDYIKNNIEKPDLILSSYGPAITFPMGEFFSKKFEVPWVVDFRDLGALADFNRNFFVKTLDKIIERRFIKKINAFITVSPTLKRILEKNYKKPAEIIFNGWDKDDLEINENLVNEDFNFLNKKYFYYAGTLYDHRIDGIKIFLKTIKKLRDENFYFVIRSLGPDLLTEKVKNIVNKMSLNTKVKILPPSNSNQAKLEESKAFCNIVFEDLNIKREFNKGNLTGKFLKLLPLDPPILFIARKDNDANNILKETKRGEVCSSVEDINRFIKKINSNKKIYNGKKNEIEKYTKENQTAKLCNYFNEIIKERKFDK